MLCPSTAGHASAARIACPSAAGQTPAASRAFQALYDRYTRGEASGSRRRRRGVAGRQSPSLHLAWLLAAVAGGGIGERPEGRAPCPQLAWPLYLQPPERSTSSERWNGIAAAPILLSPEIPNGGGTHQDFPAIGGRRKGDALGAALGARGSRRRMGWRRA
jgi:hypothetical protein